MNALTRDFVNLVNTAEENQTAKEQTSGTQFREKLHLMPPVGWLNDPNGLCQMDGVFQPFFIELQRFCAEYRHDYKV